jgi:hypothetical protein
MIPFCLALLLAAPLNITIKRVPGILTIQASITNTSPQDVKYLQKDPLTDYSLTVTDASGNPVPLSAEGRAYFSPSRPRPHFRILKTLHPGETAEDTLAIGKLFAFQHPGSYRVTVRRESTTSNTLAVDLR